MRFIDAKLEFNKPKYQFNTHQFNQKIDLQFYKLELIKCAYVRGLEQILSVHYLF